MGWAKHEMDRIDGVRSDVRDVLLEHGAVRVCVLHEDQFWDTGDPGAVEGAREELQRMFEDPAERAEAIAAIEDVLADIGDECGICANNRDRD